jgi:hypothetical protein
LELLGVLVETLHVALPLQVALAGLNILKDNASPLGMRDALGDLLESVSSTQCLNVEVPDCLDVLSELLVGLVVLVIEGAAVEVDDSRESVVVVDGSGSGNLGTETVTTNGRHGDLVLIHKPHDIVRAIL